MSKPGSTDCPVAQMFDFRARPKSEAEIRLSADDAFYTALNLCDDLRDLGPDPFTGGEFLLSETTRCGGAVISFRVEYERHLPPIEGAGATAIIGAFEMDYAEDGCRIRSYARELTEGGELIVAPANSMHFEQSDCRGRYVDAVKVALLHWARLACSHCPTMPDEIDRLTRQLYPSRNHGPVRISEAILIPLPQRVAR